MNQVPNKVIARLERAALGVLSLCLLWSLWPVLASAADRWARDARYSHGFLVPLFSLALLVLRRNQLPSFQSLRPSLWGISLIVLGAFFQVAGGYLGSEWVSSVSLLPYLSGLALLWGGKAVLLWALPS